MRRTRRTRSLGVAVVFGVAVAACGGGQDAAPDAASQGAVTAADPGVVHVHRLAVAPDDPGALYVATHTGLFRSDEGGPPQRVGDRYHDLMGFTITEDSRFLASGHPDLRSADLQLPDRPPLLGLVESPDQGVAWDPVSLLGETDFHALEARHGLLYGADSTSGRFMVSSDGVEWEARSTPGLQVIAVSPGDPDVVVGAGGGPPLRSEDGGRTWAALTSPPVHAVAWNDEALFTALPDGRVQASSDGGDTWEVRGNLGSAPEALLATDDVLYAAAADLGILRSDDGGRTWDTAVPLA